MGALFVGVPNAPYDALINQAIYHVIIF
ncbi:hypothetical protein [Aneurinibacillus sp. Ricciae_BoGa-3]